jgi:hypothetical protein
MKAYGGLPVVHTMQVLDWAYTGGWEKDRSS